MKNPTDIKVRDSTRLPTTVSWFQQALTIRASSLMKKKAYRQAIEDYNLIIENNSQVRASQVALIVGHQFLQDINALYNRGTAYEKLVCMDEVRALSCCLSRLKWLYLGNS